MMSLPTNIEDLLRRNKVESNRVEFRKVGILQAYTTRYVLLPMIWITLVELISLWAQKKKVEYPNVRQSVR